MSGISLAARLCAVAAVSVVSVSSEAALMSCPFEDGNGVWFGRCIEGQGTWQTSLQARDWDGNGVVDGYFDSFLNLSWLADANWAQTSGHDPDGRMTFSAANDWLDGLTLFGVTGWRLPTVTPRDGSAIFNDSFSNNGSTDSGFAKTGEGGGWGRHSEMGYMYYVHLGNKGLATPNDADPRSFVEQPGWGLANTGPFLNMRADVYLTDRAVDPSFARVFGFNNGAPGIEDQASARRAWLVRPGEIPVPAALPLFVSAVAVVLARASRR
jgi:hypothetical protein